MAVPKRKTAKSAQPFVDRKLGRDLLVVCVVTTLVFTPSITVDAFNPPKFLVLCFGVLYLFLKYKSLVLDSFKRDIFGFFLVLGVLITFLNLLINHYSFSERVFGIERRNFGFVTTVSLFALGYLASVARRSASINIKSVFLALMISNFFVSMIFFIQLSGLAFTEFNSYFGVLPSTLGNPNFLSSFLAISIIGILGWYFHPLSLTRWKPLGIVQIIVSLWVIVKTQSIQGLVALAVGAFVLILLLVRRYSSQKLFWLVSLFVLGGVVFVTAGLFGLGWDLTNRVPQTLLFRFVYWKIGLSMFKEAPFFGYGFDSYLDNFRSHLKSGYVETIGQGVISDSPHNLFVDFFVSGGILLGGFVLLCIGLGTFKGLRNLNKVEKGTSPNQPEEFLLVLLMVFFAIAFISPFQLSLFIWLPVILGLTASSERQVSPSDPKKESSTLKKSALSKFAIGSWIIILGVCNPIIALLPMVTEVRYRSAVESGNFYDLKAVALDWPYSGGRATAIAQGMLNASFGQGVSPDQLTQHQFQFIRSSAIDIVESSVKINPKSYESWLFLFQNTTDTAAKSRALQSLRRIDPFNPDWRSN